MDAGRDECVFQGAAMQLPEPDKVGKSCLESLLQSRRSWRSFAAQALSAQQISQILWSGQGLTWPSRGFRTAPSAGATLPLTLYAVLPEGVFRYDPSAQSLTQILSGDVRRALAQASLEQYWMTSAGLIVAVAANFSRTTSRYGARGERYVWIEVGHAAQNMHLQAEALGLGCCPLGAYDDHAVAKILHLPDNELAAYLVVVGVKSRQ